MQKAVGLFALLEDRVEHPHPGVCARTLDHREVAQRRVEAMRHSPTLGDIAAGSTATGDVSSLDKAAHRCTHRRPRHSEPLRELALGRQLGARLELGTGYL